MEKAGDSVLMKKLRIFLDVYRIGDVEVKSQHGIVLLTVVPMVGGGWL